MKKSELRFGDILVLRNGDLRKLGENNRIETLAGNLANNIYYYQDNLLYNDSTGNDILDIVKVYRLFQVKKDEILTEKEKNYICNLIKPFSNKVKGIVKKGYYDEEEYISIIINDDMNISLPNFQEGKYYKGMELDERYSIEELGINV